MPDLPRGAPTRTGVYHTEGSAFFVEFKRETFTRRAKPGDMARDMQRGRPPSPTRREETAKWTVYRSEADFRRRAAPLATVELQDGGLLRVVPFGARRAPVQSARTFPDAMERVARLVAAPISEVRRETGYPKP